MEKRRFHGAASLDSRACNPTSATTKATIISDAALTYGVVIPYASYK
jgi:hypothetical protein